MASQGRKKRKAPKGSKDGKGKRRKSAAASALGSGSEHDSGSDASDAGNGAGLTTDDDGQSSRAGSSVRAPSQRLASAIPSQAGQTDDDYDAELRSSPATKRSRPKPKPRFEAESSECCSAPPLCDGDLTLTRALSCPPPQCRCPSRTTTSRRATAATPSCRRRRRRPTLASPSGGSSSTLRTTRTSSAAGRGPAGQSEGERASCDLTTIDDLSWTRRAAQTRSVARRAISMGCRVGYTGRGLEVVGWR